MKPDVQFIKKLFLLSRQPVAGLSLTLLIVLVPVAMARQSGSDRSNASPQVPNKTPPVTSGSNKIGLAPVTPPDTRKKARLDLEGWEHDSQSDLGSARSFRYVEAETTVTGGPVQYNRKKETLKAERNLVLDDPKHHVTADKAFVEYGKAKKHAIFDGNVVVTLKPNASAESPATASNTAESAPGQSTTASDLNEERKRGVIITCDHLEDFYRKKHIVMSGHLTFHQKVTQKDGHEVNRTMTADHAEYDGKSDQMKLYPPVKYSDTEGQDAQFEEIVLVGTHEGQEWLKSSGKTHGTILIEEDDSDEDSNKPAPPAKSDPGSVPPDPAAGKPVIPGNPKPPKTNP